MVATHHNHFHSPLTQHGGPHQLTQQRHQIDRIVSQQSGKGLFANLRVIMRQLLYESRSVAGWKLVDLA
jgi:hypothetical protein